MKNGNMLQNTENINNPNGGQKSSMIFLHGNIPSSKNSKIATSKGVFHSKTVARFLREMGIQHYSASRKEVTYYKTKPCLFPVEELKQLICLARKEYYEEKDSVRGFQEPLKIGLHFVRQTKARFDFHNICQIVFDLLVAFDIIEDDNMDCILPFPMEIDGKWYSVDKNNPGCWITIL